VHRLRITKEDGSLVPNDKSITFESAGLSASTTVAVKDLGPQIAWRTVFIVEYLGPILIYPTIYALRPYIYPLPSLSASKIPAPTDLQKLSMAVIVLHFIKREFETIFIHRFSSSTMPWTNIFKNSAHYWLLAGLNIAYWTNSPNSLAQASTLTSSSPTLSNLLTTASPLTQLGLALFALGEVGNLYTHIVLKNLRPAGTTARGIPKGFGFGIVTCPNYMYEIMAWIGISLVTRSWATVLFVAVAGAQMGVWAKKKERRYRKEFGTEYRKKKFAMIPGII
jgi:very-long-chain enoyl-CoA reductase